MVMISKAQRVIGYRERAPLECHCRAMQPRSGPRRLRRVSATVPTGVVVVALLAACEQTGVSSSAPPGRYAHTAVGMAKLMRDATPRIVRVVDVSEWPDPSHATVGAVVLIDARLGKRLPDQDVDRRPVLVRYRDKRAAEQAVHDMPRGRYTVRARDVLYLPTHFPAKAADDYRKAMYVGLM